MWRNTVATAVVALACAVLAVRETGEPNVVVWHRPAPASAVNPTPGVVPVYQRIRPAVAIGDVRSYERALECVAINAWHEARSDGDAGMEEVAATTWGRARDPRFPADPCAVVAQRAQFSWFTRMRHITVPPRRLRSRPGERRALARAWVAASVARGRRDVPLYYHATYIHPPAWARRMTRVAVVKSHVFYRPGRRVPPRPDPRPQLP